MEQRKIREIRIKVYDDIPDNIAELVMCDLPKTGVNIWNMPDGTKIICSRHERAKTEMYSIFKQKETYEEV